MKLVIFDFDGTLTRRGTLFPFVWYHILRGKLRWLPALWYFVLLKCQLVGQDAFKESLAGVLFKNQGVASIRALVLSWYRSRRSVLFRSDILEQLVRYQKAGHQVMVVSANYDGLLTPICCRLGITSIIATRLETQDGSYTGRLSGPNIHGREKLSQLRRRVEDATLRRAIAFGDKGADRFVLDFVEESHWVERRS